MFFAREVRSESRLEAAECREAVNAVRASEVRCAGEGGCGCRSGGAAAGRSDGCEVVVVVVLVVVVVVVGGVGARGVGEEWWVDIFLEAAFLVLVEDGVE